MYVYIYIWSPHIYIYIYISENPWSHENMGNFNNSDRGSMVDGHYDNAQPMCLKCRSQLQSLFRSFFFRA